MDYFYIAGENIKQYRPLWKAVWQFLGFLGGSNGKESAFNTADLCLIPGLGRSPREGNGNPLQYPCLENSMDRGAWEVTVHRTVKRQTRLSDFHFLFGSFWLNMQLSQLNNCTPGHLSQRNKDVCLPKSLYMFFFPLATQLVGSKFPRDRNWAFGKRNRVLTTGLPSDMKVKAAQLCPTLCNPKDYTVHGILQARTLESVAIPFSRGSSQSRCPALQADSLPAKPQGKGSPRILEWVAYLFSSRSSLPRN